jgi:hypothetical protein
MISPAPIVIPPRAARAPLPAALMAARRIMAAPEDWAARPSLVALARLVTATARGETLPQRRRTPVRGARPA